ncbi:hypothetical protein B9Z19DRAFT_1126878 [Tuber borchii]|uniref:Uncharacterized protein n=1 Tax=Tuber borchii TaxID=42251 RepID=A0A2T6ZSA9_TUBBO|nr:hypothetical protein B9Z19DRAFT_1126878 [Tuber borchii]
MSPTNILLPWSASAGYIGIFWVLSATHSGGLAMGEGPGQSWSMRGHKGAGIYFRLSANLLRSLACVQDAGHLAGSRGRQILVRAMYIEWVLAAGTSIVVMKREQFD